MKGIIRIFCVLVAVLLGGCSDEGEDQLSLASGASSISVRLTGVSTAWERLGDESSHTVNRVLALPFRKVNESVEENNDDNFVADYASARQFCIESFPAYYDLPALSEESTWKVILIGYNSNDFDFGTPDAPGTRFAIGSTGQSATLADLYLCPTNPASVPEFFSTVCRFYSDDTEIGEYFNPSQGNNLRGTLTRIVSGLTVQLENIPANVSSVALGAQQLVRASAPLTGHAVLPPAEGESENLIFHTLAPQAGVVTFSQMLLPALDGNETALFLDVTLFGITERHPIRLPNTDELVAENRITFRPNEKVEITGDYARLDVGFTFTGTINLDDDDWDGLQ